MEKMVQQIIIKSGNKLFKQLDNLCFLSKNLYNATLYKVRQHYFSTGKHLSYAAVNKIMKEERNEDYYALPTKVSQQTQKLVDNSYKSYFALVKLFKKGELKDMPKTPYYMKKDGRQVVMFTNQAFQLVSNGIRLGRNGVVIKTNIKSPQFVRLIPNGTSVTIEIGYTVECQDIKKCGQVAAIDIGVNNLAALTFEHGKPIIYNGKPVKSINQYYNKQMAKLRSRQDKSGSDRHYTKRMSKLSLKRKCKIKDYFHKTSRELVNQLVSNKVSVLVIGHNNLWKQDTNLGKKNNQKFVQIPFNNFIQMLQYKCKLIGIKVILQEESYTSKCSFLDGDYIPTYGIDGNLCKPSGRRIKRGLYRTKDKRFINADVNGSYNILSKFLKEASNTNLLDIVDLVEVCSTPSVFTVKR